MTEKTHHYLLHTDANIARLKTQIEREDSIKAIWDQQYEKALDGLEQNSLAALDCELLGLVYRMTGEKRFAEAIKMVLLDYASRETWEGRELLNRTPPWQAGLGTSHSSFSIALGYDCAYHYLTPLERKQIADGIVRVGIKPAMDDWLLPGANIHTLDTMGHNWWSACVYMAGFALLAIKDEVPDAERWVLDISKTATEWVNYAGSVLQDKPPTFDRGGGFYESINYASYGISQYLLFRYAFSNVLPDKKQPDLSILDMIADFFIHTTYYTDDRPLSVNFGDSYIPRNGYACIVLLWNLGYQKDRSAWYLEKVNAVENENKEGIEKHTANGLVLHPDLPLLPDNYLPDLPDSQLFSDMGWATLRDSWKDNATLLAVKSGFTWNHAHADSGSFILFHNGKNLIIDSGKCTYENALYSKYYCQSEAHNVVLWDGKAQSPRDPYFGVANPGSLHTLVDGDRFKYLLANATGPTSQYFARNYRSFLWVGDVLFVYDDLLSHDVGHFEWLLHYNGESRRDDLDLSVQQGNAQVLVRPLFPETFPAGGRPHDFPEQMRLEGRLGFKDQEPDEEVPYWSISHFDKTDRTKFITAIVLENETNKDNLPVIERFENETMLGVRIAQTRQVTEVYFNLIADGRIKHRNSLNHYHGWETDAYLMALTFDEGTDRTQTENIQRIFIGHGSYLRRDDQVVMHSLSKYTALVNHFNDKPHLLFDGQPFVDFKIYTPKKTSSIRVNHKEQTGIYDSSTRLLALSLKQEAGSDDVAY